ncbi:hypothetical protein SLE2022_160010 [Rubroshorea leprosula]
MLIVVRFVDKDGFVKERLLNVVHVRETNVLTLKEEICSVLSHHNLNIQNVRGQGYDGASNMDAKWNGLQALILQECPYAYYVHCLAHQLQVALILAAGERHDELQATYTLEIARLVEINEIETGRGANQLGTVQRPTDTRWSSHFKSISSLLRMFAPTTSVLENVAVKGSTYSQREVYPLIDRLIRLVLTLPMSITTTERGFSAMKIIKTRLRNKMEDDLLKDYMIVYIEKEIAKKFTTDLIVDDFYFMKQRRAQLKN